MNSYNQVFRLPNESYSLNSTVTIPSNAVFVCHFTVLQSLLCLSSIILTASSEAGRQGKKRPPVLLRKLKLKRDQVAYLNLIVRRTEIDKTPNLMSPGPANPIAPHWDCHPSKQLFKAEGVVFAVQQVHPSLT